MSVLQVGGSVLDPDLSRPRDRGQSNRSSTILLQLLDFKTHLQEAVEELHTRRVQPTRASRAVGLDTHSNSVLTLDEAKRLFWLRGQ